VGVAIIPSQDLKGLSYKDDHSSSRWNALVTSIFEGFSGMKVGPSSLRSSFITNLLNGSIKVDEKVQEQVAAAMRHSIKYVSQVIQRKACTYCTDLGARQLHL